MTVTFGIHLPGISVTTDDVSVLFRRRRSPVRGPFVIIGRNKGLAIDTGNRTGRGSEPILWPPHAYQQQLWYFRKTPYKNEYLIMSVANGFALDARTGSKLGRNPLMWTPHLQEHQRWRLHHTPDGAAYFIESVRTRHFLDVPHDAVRRAQPALLERNDGESQQFLIMMPSGGRLGSGMFE
jgi:Ricin-type beta-trefoil lectin domain-like